MFAIFQICFDLIMSQPVYFIYCQNCYYIECISLLFTIVSRKLHQYKVNYEDPFGEGSQSQIIHNNNTIRRQFINKQPLQEGGSVGGGGGDGVKQIPTTTATQSQPPLTTLTTLTTPLMTVATLTTDTGNTITVTTSPITADNNSYNGSCEIPSIAEFPSGLFSQHQRLHGAFILHTLIAVYMCVGLAIICDYYFIPSLEVICYKLDLQADVAGASFMAIGSSAPELFASVIGKCCQHNYSKLNFQTRFIIYQVITGRLLYVMDVSKTSQRRPVFTG